MNIQNKYYHCDGTLNAEELLEIVLLGNNTNSIIGDVNCDGFITVDDLQLLSNIWNNLVNPDTLNLPCYD